MFETLCQCLTKRRFLFTTAQDVRTQDNTEAPERPLTYGH